MHSMLTPYATFICISKVELCTSRNYCIKTLLNGINHYNHVLAKVYLSTVCKASLLKWIFSSKWSFSFLGNFVWMLLNLLCLNHPFNYYDRTLAKQMSSRILRNSSLLFISRRTATGVLLFRKNPKHRYLQYGFVVELLLKLRSSPISVNAVTWN